ncbi:septum formation family protein [Leucobacter sp. 1207-22]|uniref:septum formation family protein n=1 Tax=Leucobacter sp. 1207-22 TaxID=2604456 RepID=UPI004064B567
MRLRGISSASILIGALALTGALAGCSGAPAARDAETREVTEAGEDSVFAIRVGDCTNDIASTEADVLPVVPCAEPHDNEVYHAFDLEDGEWPGEDAVMAAAEETCVAQFEQFVGVSYDASELDWWPMSPTQGSWEGLNDREVYCLAYDPAGLVEGSLAGAGR